MRDQWINIIFRRVYGNCAYMPQPTELQDLLAYADSATLAKAAHGTKAEMYDAIRQVAKERAMVVIACFATDWDPGGLGYQELLSEGGERAKVCRDLAALSDETIHRLEEVVLHQLQLEARVVAVVDKGELASDEDVRRLRRALRGR